MDDRVRAIYKGEAAKSLERAEKIKSVRQDLKPVAKDEFSQGAASTYAKCTRKH